jgi:hypothetical protein
MVVVTATAGAEAKPVVAPPPPAANGAAPVAPVGVDAAEPGRSLPGGRAATYDPYGAVTTTGAVALYGTIAGFMTIGHTGSGNNVFHIVLDAVLFFCGQAITFSMTGTGRPAPSIRVRSG